MDCHSATTSLCFAAGCFTGKALSAQSHLGSLGTVVSREVCQVLGRQWGPACPTDLRTGPCEPFDILQPPGWGGTAVVFCCGSVCCSWDQSVSFSPQQDLVGEDTASASPLQTPGTIWEAGPQHTHFLSVGEPLDTHLPGAMGKVSRAQHCCSPSAHRVLWAIPVCMRSKGMLYHLASVLREKHLIKMAVRSTVFYCSY